MNKLKKLLNVPIPYALVGGVIIIFLTVMKLEGELTWPMMLTIVSIVSLVGLQIHHGSIVIKSFMSGLAILYMTAIYTNVVMNVEGKVIEPFLLSLAAATVFLSMTYSSKKYNYGLRSRPLWTAIITSSTVIVKLAFIISGYSFLIAEVVGLNIFVIFVALWIVWTNNSKKTKIIEPEVLEEKVIEDFKFIYINDVQDVPNKKWLGAKFIKNNNAGPYVYNEAMKANEEGLHLVLVSKVKTNSIHDVGVIKINKSRKIHFLYVEAKEDDYLNDALKSFTEEIGKNK